MHIALVSPTWPPERGTNGITTYVGYLRRGLQKLGHQVTVFVLQGVQEVQTPGVVWIGPQPHVGILARGMRRLGLGGGAALPHVYSLGAHLGRAIQAVHRVQPISIIEMEESYGWFTDVSAITGIPTVVKLHGPAFLSYVEEARDTAFARQHMKIEGDALRQARFITSPSQDTLSRTCAEYGIERQRCETIPNPIVQDFGDDLIWPSPACQPDELLFVGRFDKRKGGDFVLRAFHQLRQKRPHLKLHFVGPDVGVANREGQVEKLQPFALREFGPKGLESVELHGALPRPSVYAMRVRCAITLVASRWDNQPNTALEAMLQSCPVVSTDAGSMREVVAHGQTGLLYKAEDIDDFCTQVARLLDDRALATQLGRQGREKVLAAHDTERLSRQTLSFYESALRAR